MSSQAFRMDMGNLISVPAQSAPPSYTITHAHSFMFWFPIQSSTGLCSILSTTETACWVQGIMEHHCTQLLTHSNLFHIPVIMGEKITSLDRTPTCTVPLWRLESFFSIRGPELGHVLYTSSYIVCVPLPTYKMPLKWSRFGSLFSSEIYLRWWYTMDWVIFPGSVC